ncbi:diadenylate cyclase [Nannocystis radixulma]|jgi:diadenylate cyclase|uniref:Diadenylate cyclase n=1 Tax=Nannocystis radixulma TaxID=2995305 RepID=A0ABT5BIU6_9BACT|nr:diadenylate cyclase [Nannocystis radixulma]MDC0674053.1 diadenylate cyclase [Nannocystis radixulma]
MVTPRDFIEALTWRDGLDFGILLILVYAALRLLQGTRAVPVLLSVAVFGGVAAAASALDMVAVAALVRYFLEYVIIILIVVFHQELRRILLHMGQRLLPQGHRDAARSAVSELVVAVERLSRARLGALFILQGEIDVLDVVSDRGREIDASLHADTLVALLIPYSINLTHDGAVLIQNLRIARAGVICPLTQRDRLDPAFGTRHRGAIGVSEESDALVIVLSEERGEIRMVHRGAISDPLTPEQLEARISRWLEQPRAEASRQAPPSESLAVAKGAARSYMDLRKASESATDMTAVRRRGKEGAAPTDEKWNDNDFLHAPSVTDFTPLSRKGGEG